MWQRAKIETKVEAPSVCGLRLPMLDILTDDTIIILSEIISEASTLAKLSLACKRLEQVCSTDFLWHQRINNEYGSNWKNVLSWTEKRQITRSDGSIDAKMAYALLSHPRIDFECVQGATDAKQISAGVARVAISIHGSTSRVESSFMNSCRQIKSAYLTASAPQRRNTDFAAEGFLLDSRTHQLVQYEVFESVSPAYVTDETEYAREAFKLTDLVTELQESFRQAKSIWDEIKAAASQTPTVLLVGTLADPRVAQKVSKQEAIDLASSLSSRYVEIASLDDRDSVIDALRLLVSTVFKSRDTLLSSKNTIIQAKQTQPDTASASKSSHKQKNVIFSFLRRSIKGL